MERVKLGRTDLMVSPICFGCWQMGGTYWGPVDEQALIAAVGRAVELGVNFFDTADAYGDGLAETILGKALKTVNRRDLIVATKVLWNWHEKPGSPRTQDLSYDYIIRQCERSLKRLGTDVIDLYQAHSFDVYTPLAETTRAFETLKKQGKIRFFGSSNFSVEQLRSAMAYGAWDTVQPRYNLLHREIEKDLLAFCLANDLGVLVYSPQHRGLLTGKYTGNETFDDFRADQAEFTGEQFKENVERVNRLKPIAAELSKTMPQLALRFVIQHPAVHCAIAGIKTPAQIAEAVGAAGWQLPREMYYRLRKTF